MSNPLYYLVALFLAFAYPTGIEPLNFARSPHLSLVACGVAILLITLLSAFLYGPMRSPGAFRLSRTGLKVLSLLLFGMILFVFHFPLLVWQELKLESLPGISTAVVLIPFLALMGAHALFSSKAESRIRADRSTWKGHLIFGMRTFLGFSLFPILLILFLNFIFGAIPAIQELSVVYPFAAWGIALGIITLFLLLAPFHLKLAFSASSLPRGIKREKLEKLAQDSGFRYRDLLIIDTTEARIANALIIGLLPQFRYVFFTSSLFHQMNEGELECVMAHEMSHGLRNHLTSYFLFTLGYLTLASGMQELLFWFGVPGATISFLFLLLFFVFWVILFGFVSRRYETEADLVGASLLKVESESSERPVSKATRLAQALHRVCILNGVHPGIGSWRHYSVLRRTMILLEAEANPETGKAWEATCSRLRKAGLIALCVSALYGLHLTISNLQGAPQARTEWEIFESASRGWDLLHQGRAEEAAPLLEKSVTATNTPGEIHLLLAEAYEQLGRKREAEESRKMAAKAGVTDPRFRLLLESTYRDR